DWSSDVCSSDLHPHAKGNAEDEYGAVPAAQRAGAEGCEHRPAELRKTPSKSPAQRVDRGKDMGGASTRIGDSASLDHPSRPGRSAPLSPQEVGGPMHRRTAKPGGTARAGLSSRRGWGSVSYCRRLRARAILWPEVFGRPLTGTCLLAGPAGAGQGWDGGQFGDGAG